MNKAVAILFLVGCGIANKNAITFNPNAPYIVITSGTTKQTTDRNYRFYFEVVEKQSPVALIECRINGRDFEPCQSPVFGVVPYDGTYFFEVRATDTQGQFNVVTYAWFVGNYKATPPPATPTP